MSRNKPRGEGRVWSARTGAPDFHHETFKWILLVLLAWVAGFATSHIKPPEPRQVLTMESLRGSMKLAHRYEFADPNTGETIGEAVILMKGGE